MLPSYPCIAQQTSTGRRASLVSVTPKGIISADRQLAITLPEDLPAGAVEVTITTTPTPAAVPTGGALTREQARAILLAAGLFSTAYHAPPGAVRLTDEEEEELSRLPEWAPDTATLIAEGRDERWD